MTRCALLVVGIAACARPGTVGAPHPLPTRSVGLGDCGEPERDGVVTSSPRIDRVDRDLDGDGQPEIIAVDRAHCDARGNCYWNVFKPASDASHCSRYLGTFAGATLELLATTGDDNMRGVRAYWSQPSGRLLLQSYRFRLGGYMVDGNEVLQCRRASDDQLECADGKQ